MIASDFSPRMLFNEHAKAAERRQVQTTCKHLPSLCDSLSQRGQTTDLGLKSEAITCRCSASLSADDSHFDALIWFVDPLKRSDRRRFQAESAQDSSEIGASYLLLSGVRSRLLHGILEDLSFSPAHIWGGKPDITSVRNSGLRIHSWWRITAVNNRFWRIR